MAQAITDKNQKFLVHAIEHVVISNRAVGSFYSGLNSRAAVRGSFYSSTGECACQQYERDPTAFKAGQNEYNLTRSQGHDEYTWRHLWQ